MPIKPKNKLTPDFIASLPKGWRGEKVDAERPDLSIVMPAQTWHMKRDNKRVRIPGPIHDAKLYDREAAIAEIDRLNAPPEPIAVGPVTLSYALEAWKDRQFNKPRAGKPRLGDSSKKTYSFWLNHIENWRINKRRATDMLLDAITDLDCEDLQDDLADRPATANQVIGRLRAIYKFARRKRWTLFDPTMGLDRLPTDPFQPMLSKTEHQQLCLALWNSTSPARWPLLLAAITGCRCAEAANISVSEIDGDAWTIPADRMKGRKPHIYYLKSAQIQLIARNAAGWKTDVRS